MTDDQLHYRQTFEDNNVPMFVRARESLDLLAVNQAACDFYGFSRDAFLALAPLDLYPEALHTDMWTYFDSVQAEPRVNFDTTHQLSNGKCVEVNVCLTRIEWEGTAANLVVVQDISARAASLAQLRDQAEVLAESESRYRNLFEANLTPMLVLDHATMLFIDVNRAACEYYGYTRDAFLQRGPLDWYRGGEHSRIEHPFEERLARGNPSFDTVHLKADGTATDVHVSVLSILWGRINARLVMVQDLSERSRALAQVLASNEALRRAQQIGRFGDWSHNFLTGERYWSDELFVILGLDKEDGIPTTVPPHAALFSDEDIQSMKVTERTVIETRTAHGADHQVLRPDGTSCWVHQQMVAEFDHQGAPVRVLGTLHDISDRKNTEARLAAQARVDSLTGLPNRKATSEALTASIAAAKRNGRQTAILFIDIDQFKSVNDTLGHTAGDSLLKEIAARLRAALRAEDFVGRMGGDEFVVILADTTDADHMLKVATDIQWLLKKPLQLKEEIVVSVSIGIARYPEDGLDVETLIMNADTAMYHAKHTGRATHSFFSAEMHAQAEVRLRLDNTMRRGIDAQEFVNFYQPIVSSQGEVVAAEALVRWMQADGSLVAPGDFIPHAEESGMIVALGKWILRTACFRNAQWNAAAGTQLRINVNVSAKELVADDFLASVFGALAESGMRPDLLEIELTETAISASPEISGNVVKELRRAGVRVGLDDFGTGYNSLVNLRTLQVDTLKLDKCFVDDIEHNAVDQAIAAAVISAARSLGASAVAEGVETSGQTAFLRQLNIDEMQGFHFGRPMSGDAFERYLLNHHRNEAA